MMMKLRVLAEKGLTRFWRGNFLAIVVTLRLAGIHHGIGWGGPKPGGGQTRDHQRKQSFSEGLHGVTVA